MTAHRLRTAAAKLREEGGARNVAVANMLDDAADNLEMQSPGGELHSHWDMRIKIAGDHALAVADAVLAEVAV